MMGGAVLMECESKALSCFVFCDSKTVFLLCLIFVTSQYFEFFDKLLEDNAQRLEPVLIDLLSRLLPPILLSTKASLRYDGVS
jgi:hypothetical protein